MLLDRQTPRVFAWRAEIILDVKQIREQLARAVDGRAMLDHGEPEKNKAKDEDVTL